MDGSREIHEAGGRVPGAPVFDGAVDIDLPLISSVLEAGESAYVNVDWNDVMSIVGVVGKPGHGSIVAEARYLVDPDGGWAEIAFVVDESYQRIGISTFVFKLLVSLAREKGIKGFWADVLVSNSAMMKVFHKSGLPVQTEMEDGVYQVRIPFDPP